MRPQNIYQGGERAMTVLKIPVKRDPVIFVGFSSTSFCQIYFSLANFLILMAGL